MREHSLQFPLLNEKSFGKERPKRLRAQYAETHMDVEMRLRDLDFAGERSTLDSKHQINASL